MQALSPWADDVASPYLQFQPGRTATLDVAFTYTRIPAGQFTFSGPAEQSPNSVLHLNVRDDDYYQRGIPGVTGSIEQTATWLAAVRREVGATCTRMIGASMGAYAALLFGHLLDADAIYAFSPVLRPGHLALGQRTQFRDVSPLLPGLLPRTVLTFGAFELSEYQFLLPCLQAGTRAGDVAFLADFHPGLLSLRLPTLFASPEAVPAAALVAAPYRSGLDAADVGMLAALMDTLAQRDHAGAAAVLGPLSRRDPANAGLLYRLGVHQVLAGWPAAARVSLRQARGLLGSAALGDDADLKKRSVRDYAHLLGFDALKAVHAAIDAD
jgi:hypothetical protein